MAEDPKPLNIIDACKDPLLFGQFFAKHGKSSTVGWCS